MRINTNFNGNDFQYGQKRVKQLMYGAVAGCVLAMVCSSFSTVLQLGFTILTVGASVWAFVMMFRYCKCPSCGKQITFGLLVASTCPKCRRSLVSGNKIKKKR